MTRSSDQKFPFATTIGEGFVWTDISRIVRVVVSDPYGQKAFRCTAEQTPALIDALRSALSASAA